jgi:glycosyltransferase involved in cell wall biosynthesis
MSQWPSRARHGAPECDVCLVVEGCYPYVPGGVSAWIDWLIRSQPATTFAIVSLWPRPVATAPRYALPDNVTALHHLYLQDFGRRPARSKLAGEAVNQLAETLGDMVTQGGVSALAAVAGQLAELGARRDLEAVFNSPSAWRMVERMYARDMPYSSFLHYFWAWRALLGGLFATLEMALPRARVYHTIATGYAGLLAARARLETGRPMLLTEHGIYTNERRIELLMADWIADNVDKGHALADSRADLRDLWVRAFEAYARTCYEAADEVVTLFEENQRAERRLGADPAKLRIIANGIDVARFAELPRATRDRRPTIALIGRVVPIKDVKTFISAADLLRREVPDLRALVMGATDEDPVYAEECRALVRDLGLEGVVELTGNVDVRQRLGEVHVAVLTSLSESQPLVLLEAGAAGIPFVATDVGSCREIIYGRSDETPRLGAGGAVAGLVDPAGVAEAVGCLLADEARRQAAGRALEQRVRTYYSAERAASAYTDLYARWAAAEPAPRRFTEAAE